MFLSSSDSLPILSNQPLLQNLIYYVDDYLLMPKTRKRKSKKTGKSKIVKDTCAEEPEVKHDEPSETVEDTPGTEIDEGINNLTEPELKASLKEELQRLQDEYKRQKGITGELEREREKLQMELLTANTLPPAASIPSEPAPKLGGYPDVFSGEPEFDQSFMTEPGVDKQVVESVSQIKSELAEIKTQLENKVDMEALNNLPRLEEMSSDLAKNIAKFTKDLLQMQKEIEKKDQKLKDILLDLGFEESLDINKIPPKILVLVYETILNDVLTRIKFTKGAQDTETAVNKIFENIRTHTSGSELFQFEGNKITIPNLPIYLTKKLISSKQIYITYNSILKQLLEYVPGYEPKNFKAMIKIKTQEYSIDRVIKLDTDFETFSTELDELKKHLNNINIQITNLSNRLEELPQMMEEKLSKLVAAKLDGLPEDELNEKSSAPEPSQTTPTTSISDETLEPTIAADDKSKDEVSDMTPPFVSGKGSIVLGDSEPELSEPDSEEPPMEESTLREPLMAEDEKTPVELQIEDEVKVEVEKEEEDSEKPKKEARSEKKTIKSVRDKKKSKKRYKKPGEGEQSQIPDEDTDEEEQLDGNSKEKAKDDEEIVNKLECESEGEGDSKSK